MVSVKIRMLPKVTFRAAGRVILEEEGANSL